MRLRTWMRKSSGRAMVMLVGMATAALILIIIIGSAIEGEQTAASTTSPVAAPVRTAPADRWHAVAQLQPEILGVELERYLSGFITDIAEVQALGDALRAVPTAGDANVMVDLLAERSPAGALNRACELVQELAEKRVRTVIETGLRTAVTRLWGPQLRQQIQERYLAHLARSHEAGLCAAVQAVPEPQRRASAWVAIQVMEPVLSAMHTQALVQADWGALRQAVAAQVETLWPSEEWVDSELSSALRQQAADSLREWLLTEPSDMGLLISLRSRQRHGLGGIDTEAEEAWLRLQAGVEAVRDVRAQLQPGPEPVPGPVSTRLAAAWRQLGSALADLDRRCLNDRRFAALGSEVRRADPVAMARASVMAREAGAEQVARETWRKLFWYMDNLADRCSHSALRDSEAFSLWTSSVLPEASVSTPDLVQLQERLHGDLVQIVSDVVADVQLASAEDLLPDVRQLGSKRLHVLQVMQRAVTHVDRHDVSHLVTLHGLQRWPEARMRGSDGERLVRTLRARAMPRLVTPLAADAAWQSGPPPPEPATVRIDQRQAARLVQLQTAEATASPDENKRTSAQDASVAAIPYLVGSLRIDAQLGDWMPDPAEMRLLWPGTSTLPASTGPLVRAAWSSQGIWFALQVTQPFRIVHPSSNWAHGGTSLEWWFDLRGDRAPRLAQQPLAHQFIFLPFGDEKQELYLVEVGNDSRGLGRYDLLPDRQGSRGRIHARRDDAGTVWIEGQVDMSALARSLLPGMRILAECSFNADGAVANSRQWAASKAADTWERPELWGEWLLRGTAARLQALTPHDDSAVVVVAADQVIDIVVADPDMDLDHDLIDVVAVGLGGEDATARVILLAETAPGSGLFRQRVRVDAAHFGTSCQPGAFLALRYHDASTASGGSRLRQQWLAIGR